MTDGNPDVTLATLHGDLGGLRGELGGLRGELGELRGELGEMRTEMRAGFTDLKVTLVTGFRSLPSRESSDEMVRLLREGNRLSAERFTHLDVRIREQHLETQQVLHALVESQRGLTTEVKGVSSEVKGLAADIKRLIARIDALIRGRNNGEPA